MAGSDSVPEGNSVVSPGAAVGYISSHDISQPVHVLCSCFIFVAPYHRLEKGLSALCRLVFCCLGPGVGRHLCHC